MYTMALEHIKMSLEKNEIPFSMDMMVLDGLLQVLKSSKM